MTDTPNTKTRKQQLYRVWLSYIEKKSARFNEARCEVIAHEAAKAIEAVMRQHTGIDVVVATIERVASLDEALKLEDD